jgi:hypothetical protein
MRLIFCSIALLASASLISKAADNPSKQQDYKGAAAVLKQVEEQSKGSPPEEKPSESKNLRADLKRFTTNVVSLQAAEAASQWLALFDRFLTNPPAMAFRPGEDMTPIQANDLLQALPGPPAWNDLRKLIDKRPQQPANKATAEIGLRLLAHTLMGDRSAQTNDLAAIGALAKPGPNAYLWQTIARQLNEALLEMSDDPAAILAALDQQVTAAAKSRGPQAIRVPDIVSIAGSEAASTFLRRALRTANIQLDVHEGDETRALARRLAVELINDLKTPQWQLASSLDATDLFEAMDKKFGSKTTKAETETEPVPAQPSAIPFLDAPEMDSDYSRQQAEAYYMLGLITRNREKDAAKVALRLANLPNVYLPHDAFQQLDRAGYSRALNRFFHDLLSEKPELPFWENYFNVAVKAGDAETMVALARTAASRQELS